MAGPTPEVLVVPGAVPDPVVLDLAAEVGRLLDASVRELGDGRPDPDAVIAAARDAGARAVVLRGEDGEDAWFWAVARALAGLVVVLPAGVRRLATPIDRVLLPLDGTREAAAAVSPTVHRLLETGATVIATHVFDVRTVPAFWDQAAHSGEAWSEEFLRRHLPHGVTLDLRSGMAAEEVRGEAAARRVGLVLLSWGQRVGDGRARTVRLLAEGDVPLMLVGTGAGDTGDPAGPRPSPAGDLLP